MDWDGGRERILGFYMLPVFVVWRCNVMYLAFFVPSVLPVQANGIVRWSLAHTPQTPRCINNSVKRR